MSKFTPGPWKYSRTHTLSSTYWYVITDKNGYGPIVDVGGTDKNNQIAEAKHLITNPEEIEANANLIAAAPDLYEACQLAFNLYEELSNNEGLAMQEWPVYVALSNALKKAEGGD